MSVLDLAPQTVLAFIFTVLVLKHAVGAVGKSSIVENVWSVYTWLASKAGHAKFKVLTEKRRELLKTHHERKSISAQDQYARWTKLNRSFDKLSGEISALVEDASSEKAKISKLVNFMILALTLAPIWFSRYWYRKVVLLYFPAGVFPYPVEWFLALPFTVTGGLGLTIWIFSVNSVLSSIVFVVKYLVDPAVEKPEMVVPESAQKNSGNKSAGRPETSTI